MAHRSSRRREPAASQLNGDRRRPPVAAFEVVRRAIAGMLQIPDNRLPELRSNVALRKRQVVVFSLRHARKLRGAGWSDAAAEAAQEGVLNELLRSHSYESSHLIVR
jgi:hypothetical protein